MRHALVTAIADRVVVAYDPATGAERWRLDVGASRRAVAIAPDGKHAVVTHLATDSVEMIDLSSHHATARALRHDIGPECIRVAGGEKSSVQCADPDGTSYARGAYAALFLGDDVAASRSSARRRCRARCSHRRAATAGARSRSRGTSRSSASAGEGRRSRRSASPSRARSRTTPSVTCSTSRHGDSLVVVIEHATHADAAW